MSASNPTIVRSEFPLARATGKILVAIIIKIEYKRELKKYTWARSASQGNSDVAERALIKLAWRTSTDVFANLTTHPNLIRYIALAVSYFKRYWHCLRRTQTGSMAFRRESIMWKTTRRLFQNYESTCNPMRWT